MEMVEPIRDIKKIQALKRYLKGSNARDYALFVVGINVALRAADLLGLKWGQVVNLDGTWREHIIIREGKTSKSKGFTLNDNAKEALAHYRKEIGAVSQDQYIFLSRQAENRPITRRMAAYIIKEAAQAVGVEDNIGTHSLRKTFGYHAYRAGMDLALIMEVLNHSSISMTKRYIGITQDDIADAYKSMCL